jgi:hypothetical protein
MVLGSLDDYVAWWSGHGNVLVIDEFQELVCSGFSRWPDEANSDEDGERTEDWACDCDGSGEISGEKRDLDREYEFDEAEGDGTNGPRGDSCVRAGSAEDIQHTKKYGDRDWTEERSVPEDDEAHDSSKVVGGKRDAHAQGEEEQGAYSAGEQLDTVAGTLAAFAQSG